MARKKFAMDASQRGGNYVEAEFASMLGNAFFTCIKWQCNERQRRRQARGESADGWEAAASPEVVMRQPARADKRQLRVDNNCKQRERAADESGRRGKEGIAREWAAGGRDSAREADTDEQTM